MTTSFTFDTGSRIGVNVTAHPNVTIHLESASEVVIVDGIAERVLNEDPRVQNFLDAYNPKYVAEFTAPPGALFAVHPRVAFGWINDASALDQGATFGSTGTRWDFEKGE